MRVIRGKKKGVLVGLAALLCVAGCLALYVFIADRQNLEALPEEVIRLDFEFTSVFLIPLADGYAMVDTGYDKEYPSFEDRLARLGIRQADIHYVLITHHHDDHVGFLGRMAAANPALRVAYPALSAPLLAAGVNDKGNGGGIVNRRIYALFRLKQLMTPEWDLSFPPYAVRESDIRLEGAELDLSDLLGIDLAAVATPGHSSDSVTYVYKGATAFCGDLASNFLNWAGARNLTLFNEDLVGVYASWERLIRRGVRVVATAHGLPFGIRSLERNAGKADPEAVVKFF